MSETEKKQISEQEETKNLPSSTTTVDNNEIQDSKTETTQ